MIVEEFKKHLVYAWFVIEIMLAKNNFDRKHTAKTKRSNEEILLANPRREFVISILTNLDTAMLIKSTRSESSSSGEKFHHELTMTFSFWDQGLFYIDQMLNNPNLAGYSDDSNFSVKIIDNKK